MSDRPNINDGQLDCNRFLPDYSLAAEQQSREEKSREERTAEQQREESRTAEQNRERREQQNREESAKQCAGRAHTRPANQSSR